MTSASERDPLADHLITPENDAFLFIDYQPAQLATVRSTDHALLIKNAVPAVRTIKTFGVPVVHSAVNSPPARGRCPLGFDLEDSIAGASSLPFARLSGR
jgi:nicotinamidase-related amidase